MCLSAPARRSRDLCLKPSVRLVEKQTNKQTKVALGVGFLPESEIRSLPAQAGPSLTLDIHKKYIAASSYEIPSSSFIWFKEMEFCIIANHRGSDTQNPLILFKVFFQTCRSPVSTYSPRRDCPYIQRNILGKNSVPRALRLMHRSAGLWICHFSLLGATGCSETAR